MISKSKLVLIGTVTSLLAGGSSLAMAQNGIPTGGYPPVMGGAGGNPAVRPGPLTFPTEGQAMLLLELHITRRSSITKGFTCQQGLRSRAPLTKGSAANNTSS